MYTITIIFGNVQMNSTSEFGNVWFRSRPNPLKKISLQEVNFKYYINLLQHIISFFKKKKTYASTTILTTGLFIISPLSGDRKAQITQNSSRLRRCLLPPSIIFSLVTTTHSWRPEFCSVEILLDVSISSSSVSNRFLSFSITIFLVLLSDFT